MLNARFLALLVVLFAFPATVFSDSPQCRKLKKSIRDLGTHERAVRNPLTSAKKMETHSNKADSLRRFVQSNLESCNWEQWASKNRLLTPYVNAMAEAGTDAQRKAIVAGLVELDIKIRTLIPDEPVCFVAIRKARRSRSSASCFKGQNNGATTKNLTAIAKGFCQGRKSKRGGKFFHIEMNKVAGLFEAPNLPQGLPDDVLNHWVDLFCPQTR